jgi:hypothetical protein
MTFDDETVVSARLLTEEAPNTVKALEAALPVESRLHHAKICDNEFFCQVPVNIDQKENPVYSEPGHVGFFNFRQTVCLWYGDMVPLGYSNLFAIVDSEDLPKLAEVGAKLWDCQGGIVKLEIVEEAE